MNALRPNHKQQRTKLLLLFLVMLGMLAFGCAKKSVSYDIPAGAADAGAADAGAAMERASTTRAAADAMANTGEAMVETGVHASPAPCFSEIMPVNRSTLMASDGNYYPWVELYNGTEQPLPLQEFCLALSEEKQALFALPSVTLLPGERQVVFLSGLQGVGSEPHAALALGEDASALYLYRLDGELVDRISWVTPALSGLAVVKEGNAIHYTPFPTPGKVNDPRALPESIPATMNESDPVVLNELLQENKHSLTDQDGDQTGWVELYNRSSQPVSLLGYALSTRLDNPAMWLFPDVTIEPGQYLLVFLSGKPHSGSELHASILPDPLSPVVTLTNLASNRVDLMPTVPEISPVFAVGRLTDNTFRVFAHATPGAPNEGLLFEAYHYYLLSENQSAE